MNRQLIRPAEKAILGRLVKIMLGCNLRYVQERTEEGQYVYKLDPPIDGLQFSDTEKKSLITSYATRLLIIQEMQGERIAKQEEAIEQSSKLPKLFQARDAEVERPPVDFFGRLINPKTDIEIAMKPAPTPSRVWFKFVEGFSNAVRKPVSVGDIFA